MISPVLKSEKLYSPWINRLIPFSIATIVFAISYWYVVDHFTLRLFERNLRFLEIFGIPVSWFSLNLRPGSVYLLLEEDGFTERAFMRRKKVRWKDVERFESRKIGFKKTVLIWKPEDAIPGSLRDSYGKSPDELAVLLEGWRGKYG